MSHPRALSEQQAIDAEAWFRDFERVGTFTEKAKELGVTRITLRDAIKRVRGEDTRTTIRKLSSLEIAQLVSATFHVKHEASEAHESNEPNQTGEEQLTTTA